MADTEREKKATDAEIQMLKAGVSASVAMQNAAAMFRMPFRDVVRTRTIQKELTSEESET